MPKQKQSLAGELSLEGIEQSSLLLFTEDAYLNYSMNVIRDRALPSVMDGMKPVQRRIIYGMAKLGVGPKSKYVKSARSVGEVMGRYHPHGDAAIYEAMVLMAQPFSYRYPLVDGQGNWGDTEDPKSYAAMRYTESRLAPFSQILLQDLNAGCVEFIPNFDGTAAEPKALPSRLPNILLNGTTGIAVGMATDIPPHNLQEVAEAAVYLLDHAEATVADLVKFIPGPDYPCAAEIINSPAELLSIYESGIGTVRQRAVYQVFKDHIVISALPYQVSGGHIEKQIADLISAKRITQIADVRNEYDHEHSCQITIELTSSRVDGEALMQDLCALTDLENTYRVNLNILGLDGKPQVKHLKTILSEWLSFRLDTVKRRTASRLEAVQARLLQLSALMQVFLNLEEVLQIIRGSDDPKTDLMQKLKLNPDQADYILETKLRQLARLEEIKLKSEQDKLEAEQSKLQGILSSEAKLKSLVKREIKADVKAYGDVRKSPLIYKPEAILVNKPEAEDPGMPMTIILSANGWVRAAQGTDIDPKQMTYRSGDAYQAQAVGGSNQHAVFITDYGRAYTLAINELPSARGQGEPISTKIALTNGEKVLYVLTGSDQDAFLLYSYNVCGFICKWSELKGRSHSGRLVMTLAQGAEPLLPLKFNNIESDLIVIASKQGRLLVYQAQELPQLNKGKGNKLIDIKNSALSSGLDGLAAVNLVPDGCGIAIHCGKREIKLNWQELKERISSRSKPGTPLPRGFQKVDAIEIIHNDEIKPDFTLA